MKVYLAWSGDTARRIAEVFNEWLPTVLQQVVTFFSPDDIEKGSRWGSEISRTLEECQAGILFLTPTNLKAPWILFEAGALSKSVQIARVAPILFGMESRVLDPPLNQFQNSSFSRDDISKLVVTYNNKSDHPLDMDRLNKTFDKFWPELEETVNSILAEESQPASSSSKTEVMLDEILETTRRVAMDLAFVDLTPSKPNFVGMFDTGSHVRSGKKTYIIEDKIVKDGKFYVRGLEPSMGKRWLLPAFSTDYTLNEIPDVDIDESDPFADE